VRPAEVSQHDQYSSLDGGATVTGIVRGGGDGVDMSALTDAGDFITIDTTGTVGGVDGDLGDDQIWVLAGTVTGDVVGNVGDYQITFQVSATAMTRTYVNRTKRKANGAQRSYVEKIFAAIHFRDVI
jgi:hypothetical protein